MSRIGKKPVTISAGVKITVGSDNVITVKRTERRIETGYRQRYRTEDRER